MGYPVFASGDVLNASDMNAVGLWLVKTQTVGTGVTSVTVNNAFSTDYDTYLISFDEVASSASSVITFQLSGLTTGYYGNVIYANFANGAPASAGYNNAGNITHGGGATSTKANFLMWVNGPFLSRPTSFVSTLVDDANAGSVNAYQSSSTSATGFTCTKGAGTLTGGTIRVYGLRK
jgi:hypothetical protein